MSQTGKASSTLWWLRWLRCTTWTATPASRIAASARSIERVAAAYATRDPFIAERPSARLAFARSSQYFFCHARSVVIFSRTARVFSASWGCWPSSS